MSAIFMGEQPLYEFVEHGGGPDGVLVEDVGVTVVANQHLVAVSVGDPRVSLSLRGEEPRLECGVLTPELLQLSTTGHGDAQGIEGLGRRHGASSSEAMMPSADSNRVRLWITVSAYSVSEKRAMRSRSWAFWVMSRRRPPGCSPRPHCSMRLARPRRPAVRALPVMGRVMESWLRHICHSCSASWTVSPTHHSLQFVAVVVLARRVGQDLGVVLVQHSADQGMVGAVGDQPHRATGDLVHEHVVAS